MDKIKQIDLEKVDLSEFEKQFCSCLVITSENKILLQQRPDNWLTYPGCLSTFGGKIEEGESPTLALIRELKEELGAEADKKNLVYLGAVTEDITNHTELVHHFFWKDSENTITGCYECEPRYYSNAGEAMKHPKIMEDVKWMLDICEIKGLL